MSFVQIIEYKTSKADEMNKLLDEFLEKTTGRRSSLTGWLCADRDSSGTYVNVVRFPSYEEAMRNSELPETGEMAEKMAELCDGPVVFRNLDLIREDS